MAFKNSIAYSKDLIKGTKIKVRFAWYMEITSSTDILKLKQIRVNYNTT